MNCLWRRFSKLWPWRHNYDIINSKPIFLKILVNTNLHTDFGVSMTFGLRVWWEGHSWTSKMRWSNRPCKIGLFFVLLRKNYCSAQACYREFAEGCGLELTTKNFLHLIDESLWQRSSFCDYFEKRAILLPFGWELCTGLQSHLNKLGDYYAKHFKYYDLEAL